MLETVLKIVLLEHITIVLHVKIVTLHLIVKIVFH